MQTSFFAHRLATSKPGPFISIRKSMPLSRPSAAASFAAPQPCSLLAAAPAAAGAPLEQGLALFTSTSKRRAVIAQAAAIIPAPLPILAIPPFLVGDEEELAYPEAPPAASWPAVLNNAAAGSYADCSHTWLDHPSPYNPFRTTRDEEAVYVEPDAEQRRMALEMGLPLCGGY